MANQKKQNTAEIISPGLGDIEKVRDILFGKYVENFQARFEELETRLEADVNKLKQRLTDKIANMDEAVNESLRQLDERLAEERTSRDTELGSLQAMLSDAETKLKHSISLMEDETNQNLQNVREALKTAQDQLAREASAQQQQLEKDKVGRQALALMLDEVAVKLRGEE